jgi:glutathione S-transferase
MTSTFDPRPERAPPYLFSGPLSMFGAKAQIAVLEKGLACEVVMVPFDMDRLYEPKHPEVVRINPKRQVPVLVDGDLEIFDSTQIFEYLEDLKPAPALWPEDQSHARRRASSNSSPMKSSSRPSSA